MSHVWVFALLLRLLLVDVLVVLGRALSLVPLPVSHPGVSVLLGFLGQFLCNGDWLWDVDVAEGDSVAP